MGQYADAAKRYWMLSQHLRAITDEDQRFAFLNFTVAPSARHGNQYEQRLFSRLLDTKDRVA